MRVLTTFVCLCLVALSSATPLKVYKHQYETWQPPKRELTPTSPVHIRIVNSGNPDEMVVSWDTYSPTATSTVTYQQAGSSNSVTVVGSATSFLEPMNNKTMRYIHVALLPNLAVNTKYYYSVGDKDGGFSDNFTFKTPPNGNEVLNMIVFGDLGLVNSQSMQLVNQEVQSGDVDMILHVGDFAYDLHTNNGTIGDMFFDMIENVSSTIPYVACIGNHEGKFNFSHFENRFLNHLYLGQNSGTGNNWFYSFDYMSGGAKVHMAAINTEVYYVYVDEYQPPDLTPQMIAQYNWLDEDLRQARENGADWLIVYGHRPMYCSNVDGTDCTYDAEVLRRGVNGTTEWGLEEIIAKHKVDIYLCGHEHSYERVFPVYQGKWEQQDNHTHINPQSPVHIITGSAGCQENYDTFDEVFYGPWSVIRSASWGYAHLKVYNGTHLHWNQLLDEGRQGSDDLWIIKQ